MPVFDMLCERCMQALRIDCLSEDLTRKLEEIDAEMGLPSLWVRVIE